MADDLFARAQRFWDAPNFMGPLHRRMWLAAAELPPELTLIKWDELESDERFRLLSALVVGSEFGVLCEVIRGRSRLPSPTRPTHSPGAVVPLSPRRGPRAR